MSDGPGPSREGPEGPSRTPVAPSMSLTALRDMSDRRPTRLVGWLLILSSNWRIAGFDLTVPNVVRCVGKFLLSRLDHQRGLNHKVP